MVQQGGPRNAPIDVPSKMKALITVEGKTAEVQETDVPKPNEGEILVKVNYVAQVSYLFQGNTLDYHTTNTLSRTQPTGKQWAVSHPAVPLDVTSQAQ